MAHAGKYLSMFMKLQLKVALFCFIICCYVSSTSWADGKMFSRIEAKLTTPQQRAVIFFENCRETLVIESKFLQATSSVPIDQEYAWIIPLPSIPEKVDKVHPNFLASVERKFAPLIISEMHPFWLVFLPIAFLALLVKVILVSPLSFEQSFVMFVMVPIVGLVILTASGGSISATFGTISTKLSSANVSVHDRREIGSFDTATISSSETDALLKWLNNEGFKTPEDIRPVVEKYVNEKWIFFAAKLKKNSGDGENVIPHPLTFSFQAKQPIYPMRLTGVGNGSCTVHLYVIGATQARANYFETKQSSVITRTDDDMFFDYDLRQQRLKKSLDYLFTETTRVFASQTVVVTKLVGALSEPQMDKDIQIEWVNFKPQTEIFYSVPAAICFSLNYAVPIPALIFLYFLFGYSPWKKKFQVLVLGLVVGLIIGQLVYGSLPKTETVQHMFTWGKAQDD